MQFENTLWRVIVCLSALIGLLSLAACDQAATNAPAVPTSPIPVATPNQVAALPVTTPVAAASVVLATPAAVASSAAAPPGPTPIPLAGKDYDVTLLDSSKMKLSKLLGRKKIVVVNFWATWCGPCRKEIPELIALHKEYANKNVEIVGLSVEDPGQALTLVKNYKNQAQINYKVGFAPMPMFIAFNGARPGAPIPQTFIFGKDGKLLYHIPGLRPAFKDYVAQAIDTALKS